MNAETQSRNLDNQVREVDLTTASKETAQQLDAATTLHSARTLVKQPGIRVVLISLAKGGHIPEHRAEVDITLQVLSGKVRFDVGQASRVLDQGRLLALARGLTHGLTALEDSEVLLTLGG